MSARAPRYVPRRAAAARGAQAARDRRLAAARFGGARARRSRRRSASRAARRPSACTPASRRRTARERPRLGSLRGGGAMADGRLFPSTLSRPKPQARSRARAARRGGSGGARARRPARRARGTALAAAALLAASGAAPASRRGRAGDGGRARVACRGWRLEPRATRARGCKRARARAAATIIACRMAVLLKIGECASKTRARVTGRQDSLRESGKTS